MPTWTHVADPATETHLLPAWFARRMLDARQGAFGLLLTTGDVLRIASLRAAHLGSDGTILLDVQLDHAGVPARADVAWQSKHYLGAPVPGAVEATVNLAQVVACVEFTAPIGADAAREEDAATEAAVSATVSDLAEAAETAAQRQEVAPQPAG